MKKAFKLYLASMIALLLLASCANAQNESASISNDTQALAPITIAVLPSLDAFPIFIASEMGFFEDYGLTVNLERFSSARDRDIAFQTIDTIDGLVFDLVALSIYAESGIEMVAASSTIGLASLIGAQGIESLDDLAGNTVLISRNTSMEYILNRSLRAANLSPEDVIIEEVPSLPTRLEMLLHGQAQAATLPEPFATMAINSGLNVITTTRELGINPFILAFKRETAEEKTAELQAFLNGVNAAIDFLNTSDREEFIDTLIDIVGYPEDVRDTLLLPEFSHLMPLEADYAKDVLSFARDYGLLTRELTETDIIIDVFSPQQ